MKIGIAVKHQQPFYCVNFPKRVHRTCSDVRSNPNKSASLLNGIEQTVHFTWHSACCSVCRATARAHWWSAEIYFHIFTFCAMFGLGVTDWNREICNRKRQATVITTVLDSSRWSFPEKLAPFGQRWCLHPTSHCKRMWTSPELRHLKKRF